MPAKINMIITNGSVAHPAPAQINTANIASAPAAKQGPKPSLPLNASIIARIHNVKPGCGSCGRH